MTGSTLLDPTQLNRQADAISWLTAQRDFLLKQAEDERERWESEKDGWARMAEALIGRRNKPGTSAPKDSDPDRQYYFASDNRVLREKLHDTQARLQALESELIKLRPILLMQPSFSQSRSSLGYTSSFLSSVPFPSLRSAKSKLKKKKEPKSSRHPVPDLDDQEGNDTQTRIQPDTLPAEGVESSSFLQFQTQPVGTSNHSATFTGDHYRKHSTAQVSGPLTAPPTTIQFQVSAPSPSPTETSPSNQPPPPLHPSPQFMRLSPSNLIRKVRPKSRHSYGGSVPVVPLTSDARSEHLLLAARKIGRERVGMVTGYIRDRRRERDAQEEQEREREHLIRETEKLDRERQERLADRGAGGLSYYRKESIDAVGANPKTPKRGSGNLSHYPNSNGGSGVGGMAIQSPQPLNPAFVFIDPRQTTGRSAASSRDALQPTAVDAPPVTPRQGGTGSESQLQPGKNTPLASLIDAARMMNDGGKGATGQVNEGGRRRSVEAIGEPESPVPKRRRVGRRGGSMGASRDAGGEGGEEGPGLARMKSALDVLADQAAAFSSTGNRKGKGKEKEKEVAVVDGVEVGAPKAKRKVKVTEKAREKEKEKAKSAPARKPRVRAPPKERKLAPAPSTNNVVDGAVPTAGKAAPRMISPPRPRQYSNLGTVSSSRGGSSDRVSPLDMLPPTKRTVHPPRKELGTREVQSRSIGEVIAAPGMPNSRFGFGPVTRWDGSVPEEEEEASFSSPSRPQEKGVAGWGRQQQELAREAPRQEERDEIVLHMEQEKEHDVGMIVDTEMETSGTTEPPPKLDAERDDRKAATIVFEEVGPGVAQRLPNEEPDDRQNINMGIDKPSDLESQGTDEIQKPQSNVDAQEPVDHQHSMEKDKPNSENEAEIQPSPRAVDGQASDSDRESCQAIPQASQSKNSVTSSPPGPDAPRQFPDTNPHDDDADEDADAEGEADADGDVDPDAEGDVDLGTESTFSGPGPIFTDVDVPQPAAYSSLSLVSPSSPSSGQAQLGISTDNAPSNSTLRKNLSPGDSLS